MPEEELLPLCLAIGRVFAKYGEKKNRNTARLKFLVNKIGFDEFKRRLRRTRRARARPTMDGYLQHSPIPTNSRFGKPNFCRSRTPRTPEFQKWYDSNVYGQRQAGFATVTICLPLGDITSDQLRSLADIARNYTRETIRTTVEQNIVLRWVSEADLPALYNDLKEADLDLAGAGTLSTSCPAPAPIRVNSAFLRLADLRPSFGCDFSSAEPNSTNRSVDCISRSAAASIPAASTTSAISASMA